MKYKYSFKDPYINKTTLKKINILFNSIRTRPGMYFGDNITLDILNMYILGIATNFDLNSENREIQNLTNYYFRNLHDFSHKWCLENHSVYVTGTIGFPEVLSRIFGNNIISLDYFFDMWNDYLNEKYYEKESPKNTLPYYQMKNFEISESNILNFLRSLNRDGSHMIFYLFKESCFQYIKFYKNKEEIKFPVEVLLPIHKYFYENFESGVYSLELAENSLRYNETNAKILISTGSLSLKDSAFLWEKHNL